MSAEAQENLARGLLSLDPTETCQSMPAGAVFRSRAAGK